MKRRPTVDDLSSPPLDSGAKDLPAERGKRQPAAKADIDAFLAEVETIPAPSGDRRGRLIFALDATASRQPTWDRASSLQSDMFTRTQGLGGLDVQLVYYRGYRECRASPWVERADRLVGLMRKVTCEAGRTQIERVLKHALAETRGEPVQAVVFVGDACEENIDTLGDLAGQLKLLQLPLFLFQEGRDPAATRAFAAIARLSGGAHCSFDEASAEELGRLLNAVATYAAGGRAALQRLGTREGALLLEQLG